MATGQTGKNVSVRFKVQSALGTAASGSGGTVLAIRPSRGLDFQSAVINSGLVRPSGNRLKGRQGAISIPGAYQTELRVSALDELLQAATRWTWVASANITEATASLGAITITDTGETVTAAAGSWHTAGVKIGMLVKFTNLSTAGNNGIWVPVVDITSATVLKLAPGYIGDNASDSAWTMTLPKYLSAGAAPVERYYTFEEVWQDIDTSKIAQDCKLGTLRFSARPNDPVLADLDLLGISMSQPSGGSSPSLTSPTEVNAQPLVLLDGKIIVDGAVRGNLTGFDFALNRALGTLAVLGTRNSPDVYSGDSGLDGSMTGAVEDSSDLTALLAETETDVLLHCAERDAADPKDFISFFLPALSRMNQQTPLGNEGALIQTVPFIGGEDIRGTANGYLPTPLLICTSAA